MASSSFTTTSSITPKLFGRAGYNGPNRDEEDDNNDAFITMGAPLVNSGRGDDDDDDDQGRAGYN